MNRKKEYSIADSLYSKKEIEFLKKQILMLKDSKLSVNKFLLNRIVISTSALLISLFLLDCDYLLSLVLGLFIYITYYFVRVQIPLKKREDKLDREALEFFEILTLTLESGKNLENALDITVDNLNTEISLEFRRALDEVKYGKSLVESLNCLKKKIPSESINNIILNLTQSCMYGNNIIDTMNEQVNFLRDKQLLEIREKMNKLPNKISIISVLFILPIILLLVLGPFLASFLQN